MNCLFEGWFTCSLLWRDRSTVLLPLKAKSRYTPSMNTSQQGPDGREADLIPGNEPSLCVPSVVDTQRPTYCNPELIMGKQVSELAYTNGWMAGIDELQPVQTLSDDLAFYGNFVLSSL